MILSFNVLVIIQSWHLKICSLKYTQLRPLIINVTACSHDALDASATRKSAPSRPHAADQADQADQTAQHST